MERGGCSNEQKALQYLLRAEATFRQIEVAFAVGAAALGVSIRRARPG